MLYGESYISWQHGFNALLRANEITELTKPISCIPNFVGAKNNEQLRMYCMEYIEKLASLYYLTNEEQTVNVRHANEPKVRRFKCPWYPFEYDVLENLRTWGDD